MLVYFAIVLTALMGFCGLAIDVGRMELRTTQMQAAADAGALAGAGELSHGGNGSNWQTAAQNDVIAMATANGLPLTGSMTATLGADYGPYVGDYSTVEVTLTQPIPTIFLGLLTKANASVTLSVKAVAQMPPCMYYMGGPNVTGTYDFWNASTGMDTVQGCPIYSRNGLQIDGFAHIAGSQIRSSSPQGSSKIDGSSTYTPMYNVPVLADPLAYLPVPSAGPCKNAAPLSYLNQASSVTVNLTPGTYCGSTSATPNYMPGPGPNCGMTQSVTTPAIDIEGSYVAADFTSVGCPHQTASLGGNCLTRPTVNFAPGLYIFIGGINLNCVSATGSGVTLYFTKSSSVDYGQMRMTSSAWSVSAPNDTSAGGITGMIVMNDRNWPVTVKPDFQWNYSTWYGDGVIYLTGTGFTGYNLPMSAPNYFNVVSPNMYNYLGEVRPSTNYSNLVGGNPLHTVVSLVQ